MLRPRFCLCVLCAALSAALALAWFLATAPSVAADPPKATAPAKPVSFINDVAPILKENCFACHDAKKRSGKFEMTTFEKLMKGGAQDDQPIVPGKPDDSGLYSLIVSESRRRMPPRDKGEAVPADKAAIIARWIEQGAKLDAGLDPKADLLRELRVRWQPPAPPTKYPFAVVVTALAFTPDGKQVVVSGHHELTVWDATMGKLVKRLRTRSERAHALAFLPDGKLVVAGGRPGQEGDVRVYDLSARPMRVEGSVAILDGVKDRKVMLSQLLDTDDSVLCVAVSADGKKLAAGGCDRIVRVWDVSQGVAKARLEQSIENHADWVLSVAFSPDGKRLLTASRDKTAKVWDLKAKESVLTFPDHQQPVYSVAVKADGSVGYSVGADKQLRSWKIAGEGKQLKNAGGHSNDVYQVVVVPKQPLLVTCSADSTVRIWKADSLASVRLLTGLSDFVYAVAVSPDGKHVAAGSYKGEVAVWTTANGKLVKKFSVSPGLSSTATVAAKK